MIECLNTWALDHKGLIELMKALMPVFLTVFAIYIAFQQYKTARRKLKLDLFEKRFHVFDALRRFMQGVITGASYSEDKQAEFHAKTKGAQFLFDEKIKEYIDQAWGKLVELEAWKEDLNTSEHAKERAANMLWFSEQLKVIDQKFTKFLKVEH